MLAEQAFSREYYVLPENVTRVARSIVSPVVSKLRDPAVWKDTFTEVASSALIGGAIKVGTGALLAGTGGFVVAAIGGALAGAGIEYFRQVRENIKNNGFSIDALKPLDLKRMSIASLKGALGGAVGFGMADLIFDHISLTGLIAELPFSKSEVPEVLIAGWNNLSEVRNQISVGPWTNRIFENPDPFYSRPDLSGLSNSYPEVSSLTGLAAAEVAKDLLETDLAYLGIDNFDPFNGMTADGVHHAEIFKTYIENNPKYQIMLEAYKAEIWTNNHPDFFVAGNNDLIYHFLSDMGWHSKDLGPQGPLTTLKILEGTARRKLFEDFFSLRATI